MIRLIIDKLIENYDKNSLELLEIILENNEIEKEYISIIYKRISSDLYVKNRIYSEHLLEIIELLLKKLIENVEQHKLYILGNNSYILMEKIQVMINWEYSIITKVNINPNTHI